MQNILRVGAVTSTHGLAGEVKVFPTTDDPDRFRRLKSVLLETKNSMRELEVERVRFFKNLVIVKFRGLDRIEDVEGFRGCSLYVTRENAVKLEEGEYFIPDLLGLTVYADEDWRGQHDDSACACSTDSREISGAGKPEQPAVEAGLLREPEQVLLGELTDVLQTGANDVYEVTLDDGRQVLIPAIRQCILDVSLEKGTMLVHLLEGLLE